MKSILSELLSDLFSTTQIPENERFMSPKFLKLPDKQTSIKPHSRRMTQNICYTLFNYSLKPKGSKRHVKLVFITLFSQYTVYCINTIILFIDFICLWQRFSTQKPFEQSKWSLRLRKWSFMCCSSNGCIR